MREPGHMLAGMQIDNQDLTRGTYGYDIGVLGLYGYVDYGIHYRC